MSTTTTTTEPQDQETRVAETTASSSTTISIDEQGSVEDEKYVEFKLLNDMKIRQLKDSNRLQLWIVEEEWVDLAIVPNIELRQDDKQPNIPRYRTLVKEIVSIFIAYLIVIVVVVVGAIPIWAIESHNEKKETGTVTTWTYGRSIYFEIVSVLTIGYGDMVPTTRAGKRYNTFFLWFGLAVTGTFVAFIASSAMVFYQGAAKRILRDVDLFLFWAYHKLRRESVNPTVERRRIVNAHLFTRNSFLVIFLYLTLHVYLAAGAGIMSGIEGWSYFDSYYWSFVTLSTIGYGDFYPTTTGGRIFFGFFALLGVGLLSTFLGLFGAIFLSMTEGRLKRAKKVLEKHRQKHSHA